MPEAYGLGFQGKEHHLTEQWRRNLDIFKEKSHSESAKDLIILIFCEFYRRCNDRH